MKRRFKVVRGDKKYPFSTGAVVESLQGAGVTTDQAIQIARSVEKSLRNADGKNIKLADLLERLTKTLEEEVDEEAAKRFRQQTPPFVPLTVEARGEHAPFSRRTLAASLQKLDISFKEAHAVAQSVEQSLRTEGFETVTERDLAHLVALNLEARLGRDVRLRYEVQTSGSTELFVHEEGGYGFPYSRGILAQSLMAVGLGPELSHGLAKRVEDVLWRTGRREVDRNVVRRVVRSLLLQEAGEEFARRYELMRTVRRPDQPIVILIGGAPGVGKSSLASEIGYRLGISRIVSSDSVRQALRSLISAELSPALHASSFSAWRAELLPGEGKFAKPKRKRVIRGFQRQVQQLGTALSAIVQRNIDENTSLVMEGIHLVPGFLATEAFEGATVVEFVIRVSDEEEHKGHFGLREVQTRQRRPREGYLEHFPEIRILQNFIVSRAERAGVPVIEAGDFDDAVESAIELVLNTVLVEHVASDADEIADEVVGDEVVGESAEQNVEDAGEPAREDTEREVIAP